MITTSNGSAVDFVSHFPPNEEQKTLSSNSGSETKIIQFPMNSIPYTIANIIFFTIKQQ